MKREKINKFQGKYRFLSNRWFCSVTMYEVVYRTTEHAFQAAKTINKTEREMIRMCETPAQAKSTGQLVSLRPGWDEMKLWVMTCLNRRKFGYESMRQKLLATDNAELIEGNKLHIEKQGF